MAAHGSFSPESENQKPLRVAVLSLPLNRFRKRNTFFDSFGFEKVHVVEVEAINPKKGQTSTSRLKIIQI